MKILLITLLLFSLSTPAYAITIEKVIDSETEQEIPKLKTTDGDLYVSDSIRANIENLKNHTVIIIRQESEGQYRGAGIAIDKRHILTVNHITSETGKYFYNEKEDSRPYWATVIKQEPSHDIALLEIDKNAPDLIAEPMTFAKEILLDEPIYTIGHPQTGLYNLTQGKVGSLKSKGYHNTESIQLDIRIHEGNSGGFVINRQGEIVGMIFSAPSKVGNIGYMIGKEDIKEFIHED